MTTEPNRSGSAVSGFVLVDKPDGWTSHDVVARVRRLAGTRKVGHAGTLDPLATGLLVVGVNRATRLLGHLSGADKEYVAEIVLGVRTHSDDADGDVLEVRDASALDPAAVEAAMEPLRGDIEQVPSSVSAIKVDGKRSHQRVRDGEEVVLPARPVHVEAFELLEFVPGERAVAKVRVACSAGTYVRSLARDLGAALGVGGHVLTLRRTRSGRSEVAAARTLEQLEKSFSLVPMADVARTAFEGIDLDEQDASAVRFGRALEGRKFSTSRLGALFAPDGEFLALYENSGDGMRAVAVFV